MSTKSQTELEQRRDARKKPLRKQGIKVARTLSSSIVTNPYESPLAQSLELQPERRHASSWRAAVVAGFVGSVLTALSWALVQTATAFVPRPFAYLPATYLPAPLTFVAFCVDRNIALLTSESWGIFVSAASFPLFGLYAYLFTRGTYRGKLLILVLISTLHAVLGTIMVMS